MGTKNSPNSARLLWQIGSRTVKREKRPSRLIERKKESHGGFESLVGSRQYVLAIQNHHTLAECFFEAGKFLMNIHVPQRRCEERRRRALLFARMETEMEWAKIVDNCHATVDMQ